MRWVRLWVGGIVVSVGVGSSWRALVLMLHRCLLVKVWVLMARGWVSIRGGQDISALVI